MSDSDPKYGPAILGTIRGDANLQPKIPLFPTKNFQGDPVILSASVTVQSGSAETFPTPPLTNKLENCIEIHEFRVIVAGAGIRTDPISGSPIAPYPANGGMINLTMSFRSEPIVARSLPVATLTKLRADLGFETLNDFSNDTYVANTNAPKFYAGAQYRIVLPTPMILPPGDTLNVNAQHNAAIPTDLTVKFSIVGKVLDLRKTAVTTIPYFSGYQTPPVSMSYLTDSTLPADYEIENISAETDMQNTTPDTLRVLGIVGRMFVSASSAPGSAAGSTVGGMSENNVYQPLNDIVYCGLGLSNGYQIARDPIPFRMLFYAGDRNFPCDFELLSGEYMKAIVIFKRLGFANVGQNLPDSVQPYIVYQAQREVTLNG